MSRSLRTDTELANLAVGSAINAAVGAINTSRVHKLACSGRTASDVMLITGLSRATVYRAMRRALGVHPLDEFEWPDTSSPPGRQSARSAPRDPLLL